MEIKDATEIDSLRLPLGDGVELLGSKFDVRKNGCQSEQCTFYDTWVWSLWSRRMFLFSVRDKIHLAGGEHGWPGSATVIANTQRPFPRFGQEFSDSQIREKLSEIIGLRALRVVVTLRTIRQNFDLLNENQKVVCRLELTEIFTKRGEPFDRLISLRALRGYKTEAKMAWNLLKTGGATPIVNGPFTALLEQEGRTPQPYTLKPIFHLHPDLPAREAVRKVLRRMLEIAVSTEHGIVEDIDSEFLHDYRICIRNVRSVLAFAKGVYPQEQTESLKRTLAALGSATNRLRDLDVCMLAKAEYSHWLQEELQLGLETMFGDFARERKRALRQVRHCLTSFDYRNQMEALARFLTAPDTLPVSPASHQPIGPLVVRRIRKHYRTIRRLQRKLTPSTPDEVVHQLRLRCKKLRYLLQCFSELFASGDNAQILKKLRRLQNRLGRFNDYSVQQVALLQYWKRKRQENVTREVSDALSLSLGGIVALLFQKQQSERKRIRQELEAFCGKDVEMLFQRMFEVEPIEHPGGDVIR